MRRFVGGLLLACFIGAISGAVFTGIVGLLLTCVGVAGLVMVQEERF